jgi:hypothetical protein
MFTMTDYEDFIARYDWKNSKSYEATAPHEYLVRKNIPAEDQDIFNSFIKYIRDHGIPERFWRQRYVYLYMYGWKYWTMGAPVTETTIINRARVT